MPSSAPSLREMMRALIAAPSVSSVSAQFDMGNRRVIELLAQWLEDIGFVVELIPLSEQPWKANLLARLGEGEDGLALAGHTDTVPYDAELWRHEPLELTEHEGRLYGLGTSDMKGFLAIAVDAARAFHARQLKRPLLLIATADEESTMIGAKRLTELGRPRARYALIGEPTGLAPVRLHKGVSMDALKLFGRSGHSSDPSLGINALDGMHEALGEIKRWREELAARYRREEFAIPYPTLNLGHIHGGDNPNRICGYCELHYDMRLLPGMDMRTLRPELEARLHKVLEESGLRMQIDNLDVEIPAFETPADADLVTLTETLSGRPARSVAFGTEAPFLQRLGMETVVLGPGDIEQAHQPDEYLAIERIAPMSRLLDALIRRICL